MRDPATFHRWKGLGRLLPRSVRRRYFEPAYHDLIADMVERGRSLTGPYLPSRVVLMALDCARVSASNSLVRDRRPTRVTWTLLVGVSLCLIGLRMAALIGGYADASTGD